MTMITCKICIATRGFSLADKDRIFETEDRLYEHIENEHGQPVIREGETKDDAINRCRKKGIVPDRSKCKCGDCKREREEKKSTRKTDDDEKTIDRVFRNW